MKLQKEYLFLQYLMSKCTREYINNIKEKWRWFDRAHPSIVALVGIEDLQNLLISEIKWIYNDFKVSYKLRAANEFEI
jgi:hypothetical protein